VCVFMAERNKYVSVFLQLQEQLTKQNHTFQATCSKHNKSEAVNTDLQTQLQSIEEVLNRNIEEQKQLQTAISRLTKTVGLQNQTVQVLCEHPEKVSTCKLEAFTVRLLKYLRQSGTSAFGQTAAFRGKSY